MNFWLVLGAMAVAGALAYFFWRRVWQPNMGKDKGPAIQNATMRGRSILLDERFGQAEVVCAEPIGEHRANITLRDRDGHTLIYQYFVPNIVPFNTLKALCGQDSPIWTYKKTLMKMDGEDIEYIEKAEQMAAKVAEAESEAKLSKKEVDERADQLAEKILKAQQMEKSYGGFAKS